VRNQLQELEEERHTTIEKYNNYAEDFYDNCTEYIQENVFATSYASSAYAK
jgi:hypothetical protein